MTDILVELEQRLAQYPRERYPIQHATVQFHLGTALVDAGRLDEAEAALRRAIELFAPLPLERAKALNALGAALRIAGRARDAADVFRDAEASFGAAGSDVERGAALFNLGLALREAGDSDAAIAAFEAARGLLDEQRVPAQAGAAARELGAVLLARSEVDSAVRELSRGVELAERAGDAPGIAAAANTLGLARLAAGDVDEAIDALRTALAATSRAVRPAEYAMVKANLALAYERVGDPPRARLAARQALAVQAAAAAVVGQAESVLARLPPSTNDVAAVLEEEPADRHGAVVREEVLRWADAGAGAEWIDVQLAFRDAAEPVLAALLELPPEQMERVLRDALSALPRYDAKAREHFRADVAGATARFHTPQLLRLRDVLDRLSAELGLDERWS